MKKLPKELVSRIENCEFTINISDNKIEFQKFSKCGHNFSFSVGMGENLIDLQNNLFRYYDSFDVSAEAYFWLDSSGHGTNGSPYDMRDVYNDIEECVGFAEELEDIIRLYSYETLNTKYS